MTARERNRRAEPLALLVEDDESSLLAMDEIVRAEHFETLLARDLGEARKHLERSTPDLALVDLVLPDGRGSELLEHLEGPASDVVLITGEATVQSAVEAMRRGAVDYLTKPVEVVRLEQHLRRVRDKVCLRGEVRDLRRELRELGRFGSMIGPSPEMQRVYDLIEKVSPTNAPALIIGETGTGKELAAETIHRLSPRRVGSYIPVNCGAISASLIESELFGHERGSFTGATQQHIGFFERASGGTLFLDEITEMPFELQVKLLRVLESGRFQRVGGSSEVEVDVRVLAATNRSAELAVEEGKLRRDLFYRLNVFPIELAPLRDRYGDVEVLVNHFLDRLNRRDGVCQRFDPAALDCLLAWHWPGNVRELKNVVERASILADDVIDVTCLPLELRNGSPYAGPSMQVQLGTSLAEAERRMILATLRQCDGQRKKTAEALGISVKTLYNRLKEYGEERS
ncbi:MAG TPA: sigma-54 dependent transcriptional regulator [Thermoanaerobaculia bacterium]|nr:sigma-54 dependent transcriptional regulator [Thermoanaerobaculia bacterium]